MKFIETLRALPLSRQILLGAVVAAIVVAGGAGDVLLQCEARISRVIEELLSFQDGGAEFFRGDGIHRAKRHRRIAATLHEAAHIMHADGAAHEVVHEEGSPIW